MSAEREAELVSSFTTDSTTLFCSLKAPKRFPHWTEDCPDATPAPTEATLEPTVATSEPTVATTTTVTTTTTPRPVVDTFSADGGQRRLLRRGRRGKGRSQFQVSAGQISGFKNKGGCRDDDSFTCFDDLLPTDCAYTDIEVTSTDGNTVTLTLESREDDTGATETIVLVCPFEGKVKGSDCDAPEEEKIRCKREEYVYEGDTHRFDLECSTEEKPWTSRDGTDYPACPSALQ